MPVAARAAASDPTRSRTLTFAPGATLTPFDGRTESSPIRQPPRPREPLDPASPRGSASPLSRFRLAGGPNKAIPGEQVEEVGQCMPRRPSLAASEHRVRRPAKKSHLRKSSSVGDNHASVDQSCFVYSHCMVVYAMLSVSTGKVVLPVVDVLPDVFGVSPPDT